MSRVTIIGAGISGLAAAYYIKRYAAAKSLSVEVRIIEREKRLGGTILTASDEDGYVVEGGPDCFLSEKPWAAAMAKDLGIANRIKGTNDENKGTYILSNGKLYGLPDGVMLMVPTRIWPMVTSGLLSIPGKIRMGMDYFIKPRKDDVEETLAEFVTRRLGKEALDKIAEPLVAGVHAGVPETMSLRATFPRFKKLEEEHGSLIKGMLARMEQAQKQPKAKTAVTMFSTFQGGLGELVSKISGNFGKEEVILGSSVSELMKKTAGGWLIERVGESRMESDAVILATPSYVAGELLASVDLELADELKEIPYTSTATISMAFETKLLPDLKGFGFVVPRREKRQIMAATWTSKKFFNRAPEGVSLLRCFLGGAHQTNILHEDDDTIIKNTLQELRTIIGLNAQPIKTWIFRWPFSMPQMVVGHETRMKGIDQHMTRHPGLMLIGGAYYGLGIPDCIHQGQLAAQKYISSLK